MDQFLDSSKFEVKCHFPSGLLNQRCTITYRVHESDQAQHLYAHFNRFTLACKIWKNPDQTELIFLMRKTFGLFAKFRLVDNLGQRLGFIQGLPAGGSKYVLKDAAGNKVVVLQEQSLPGTYKFMQPAIYSANIEEQGQVVGTLVRPGIWGESVSINLLQNHGHIKLDRRLVIALALLYDYDVTNYRIPFWASKVSPKG